jgi:UDP-galactopyranose mutase
VHIYGPHLFHTNSKKVWDYVNEFTEFNQYQHRVKAQYKGKVFDLPFNLSTFNQFWGVTTPDEAYNKLRQKRVKIENPQNLEEMALSQVGEEIYHTLIYGYTKKQWGREPRKLPASIIKRLPIRFYYDTNYKHDAYQGVPVKGFTHLIENMLDEKLIDVKLETDFFDIKNWESVAKKLVYSGPIDTFFNYEYGALEYRSLRFQTTTKNGDFQGIGQMNHTEDTIPYTRIIEHKHFYKHLREQEKTVITFEYPQQWDETKPRYYPINDDRNQAIYEKYKILLELEQNIIVGGRLGSYKYFDMDQVVAQALNLAKGELSGK